MKYSLFFFLSFLVSGTCILRASEDLLIANFEGALPGNWKSEGAAFGIYPSDEKSAAQAGLSGFNGKGLVHSCTGKNTKLTGTLTSPEFLIERDYINLLIGGGVNKEKIGVKLLVEGEEVGRVTGCKSNTLDATSITVKDYRGKNAVVVIFDQDPGWWGFIAVDDLRQSDRKVCFETVEKQFTVTGKLLVFPVAKSGVNRTVTVTDGAGVKLHSLSACLAQSPAETQWWGYLEVDEYIGKTVTVSVEQVSTGSLLEMIECSDEPRMVQPKYAEALRPQFHFSQLTGWNNDPNGLYWADGFFHVFWQCNPLGTSWGNMYWGHAKSTDLVHWTEMNRAVRSGPGKGTPDNLRHPSMAVGACFSGGGNVDVNNTAGWKTGDKDVQFLLVSDMNRGQSIAFSVDGGETFKFYDKNPVFKPEGNDAKPLWYSPGKHWVAVVYENNKEIGDSIGIWTSSNLKEWSRQSSVKDFHECPELFELPVDGNPTNKKWVIAGAKLDYLIGSFDGKQFTPDSPEKRTMLTKERVYAGQCFSNVPGGRMIYMAWARVDMGNAPFNQGFTIPMELTLKTDAGGQVNLYANPVKEIETLRQEHVLKVVNLELNSVNNSVSKSLSGQLYDVCITLQKKGGPKQAVITVGGTSVIYDFIAETCGGRPAPMTAGKVNIRLLIDRPTAEIFGADGYSYDLRKRPDAGNNVGQIGVKVDAPQGASVIVESLIVYPLKSIWPNASALALGSVGG